MHSTKMLKNNDDMNNSPEESNSPNSDSKASLSISFHGHDWVRQQEALFLDGELFLELSPEHLSEP